MKRLFYKNSGASLIEMMLVMTIFGLLIRLVTGNLFENQQRVSFSTTRDTLITDVREQQMRAISGDTSSAGSYLDYSVKFEQDRYVLFPGTVYDSGNAANTVVDIGDVMQFSSITFPSGVLTFSRLGGDVRNWQTGTSSVTLTNTQTGQSVIISFNKYGVPLLQ